MLREHSPAHRAEPVPPPPPSRITTLFTSVAVGVIVALFVLATLLFNFIVLDEGRPANPTVAGSSPSPSASKGETGSVTGGIAPGDQTTPAATAPATSPAKVTIPPGLPDGPGEPVRGVQLGSALPLADIHQDQGSSIPLPDGRTLWIFADTFQLYNEPKFFITSSAGTTTPGSWQLQYSRTKDIPTEFLPRTAAEKADRRNGDHYQAVWPTGATLLPDGRIIISYAKYRVLLKTKDFQFLGAGLFEYRYRDAATLAAGDHATRIAYDLWSANDGEVRSPIYVDGYVYFNQCRDLKCQSVRTTPAGLTDRRSYRWFTGNGWSSAPSEAQDMLFGSSHPGGNAAAVRLRSGGYAMADTEIGVVATSGLIWVAPNPWGPWSQAAGFDFPRCPAPGCYGLNIHPSQSTDSQLRISYATNGVGPFVRVADIPVSISPDHSAILVR